MSKATSTTDVDILQLAAELANRGSKGPPMSTRDALKQLARTAADPVTRRLAAQRLKLGVPVLSVGRRFASTDSKAYGPLYGDKLARRIERRRAVRAASHIEREIDKARKRNSVTRAMASNSHEARRVIEEDRRLARAGR